MAQTVFFHLLGEPLLHNEIFDAIRLANEKNIKVSLYTNGALLDETQSTRLLETLKKGRIVLSLQESSPSQFKHRAKGNMSWDTYLNQLESFILKSRKFNVPVQIHYMVNVRTLGWNFKKIKEKQKEIQDIFNKWTLLLNTDKKASINILNPIGTYELDTNLSLFVKHEGQWANQLIDDNMQVIKSTTGHCALMNDTFAILADGTCTYCCSDYNGHINLGNANKNSLEEIYYNPKSSQIRAAEEKGQMLDALCQICRGRLVYKGTLKRVPQRNLLSEYYFFKEHFQRYGVVSTGRKIIENLKRRLLN